MPPVQPCVLRARTREQGKSKMSEIFPPIHRRIVVVFGFAFKLGRSAFPLSPVAFSFTSSFFLVATFHSFPYSIRLDYFWASKFAIHALENNPKQCYQPESRLRIHKALNNCVTAAKLHTQIHILYRSVPALNGEHALA